MLVRIVIGFFLVIAIASNGFADATIPTADEKGSKDNPLLGRVKGAFIISYDHKDFAEFTFPLSKLERIEGKKDNHNNIVFAPTEKKPRRSLYSAGLSYS